MSGLTDSYLFLGYELAELEELIHEKDLTVTLSTNRIVVTDKVGGSVVNYNLCGNLLTARYLRRIVEEIQRWATRGQ